MWPIWFGGKKSEHVIVFKLFKNSVYLCLEQKYIAEMPKNSVTP